MSSNEPSTVILDEFCLADEELLAVLERAEEDAVDNKIAAAVSMQDKRCEEECVITHERRCGRELVDNL